MQTFSFDPNSEEHTPSSLQPILPQYTAFTSPFMSESQSSPSEKPYIYEKSPSAGLPGTETLYNPLADMNDSFHSQSPDLSQYHYQECPLDPNPMESRGQQYKRANISGERGDEKKSCTLPKGWTEEKDELLLKVGSQYKGEWKKLARKFAQKSVTPRFLKHRFGELTSAPKQKRIKFHPNEDVMLAKYYEKYGSNWAQIATHFPNRTAVMLKNRYYAYIRKEGILGFLIEKVKEMEQNECIDNDKFEENPLIFIEQATPESSIDCKEEINSGFEVKLERIPAVESAAEVAALRKQVEFYQTLYFKTKFELDSLKAQVSGRTYEVSH